jgi:hypothetical protein
MVVALRFPLNALPQTPLRRNPRAIATVRSVPDDRPCYLDVAPG